MRVLRPRPTRDSQPLRMNSRTTLWVAWPGPANCVFGDVHSLAGPFSKPEHYLSIQRTERSQIRISWLIFTRTLAHGCANHSWSRCSRGRFSNVRLHCRWYRRGRCRSGGFAVRSVEARVARVFEFYAHPIRNGRKFEKSAEIRQPLDFGGHDCRLDLQMLALRGGSEPFRVPARS